MNREQWNSIELRGITDICSHAYTEFLMFKLVRGKFVPDVVVHIDGRRKKTFESYIEQHEILTIVPDDNLDNNEMRIAIDDKLMAIGQFQNWDRPSFPDPQRLNINKMRRIVKFFSTRTSSDANNLTSNFNTSQFSTNYLVGIQLHLNEYFFTASGDATYTISKKMFNKYVNKIKDADRSNAISNPDNLSEYLNSLGIADGSRLINLLSSKTHFGNKSLKGQSMYNMVDTEDSDSGDGRPTEQYRAYDMDMGSNGNNDIFGNLTDSAIRKGIKSVGVQLAELDKDLTLLQYADVMLKRSGGIDTLRRNYVDQVNDLVEKTYSGVKGHVKT